MTDFVRDSGQVLALKAVRKQTSGDAAPPSPAASSREVSAALKERTALAGLQHPFVVSLHCAFQTKQHLYLALDFCAGGDLAMYVRHAGKGGLPEPTAQFVSAEVLLALEYLHGEGVIHRDVKAENALVFYDAATNSAVVKLSDFGSSREADLTATMEVAGTPLYAAPELLRRERCAHARTSPRAAACRDVPTPRPSALGAGTTRASTSGPLHACSSACVHSGR